LQQLGLLVAKRLQHQFFFRGKEGVEEALGDADLSAQDLNTAVDQTPVHDTLERGGQKGFPHLFPLML